MDRSFVIAADVHILDIAPKISRSLELPLELNFAQLHEALQAAFGWTDSHLHQFNVGGLIIGAPEFDEDGLFDHRTFEATEVRLQDLVFPLTQTTASPPSTSMISATVGVTGS